MQQTAERPDVDRVLAGLKDFQRDTVDYVFRRLFTDPDRTRRFLLADEVGLGKTLVARGVTARCIDHLWRDVERIDVLYVCSNADIARQNVRRLTVSDQRDYALASRITLLPREINNLRSNKVNFISFTPGTSLDPKSQLGSIGERALLFVLLDQAWGFGRHRAPYKVLQGFAHLENFEWKVARTRDAKIDAELTDRFIAELERHPSLRDQFVDLRDRFRSNRGPERLSGEDKRERGELVSRLRSLLAAVCVEALEPDLVILDEFQRFRSLLDGDDEAGRLAQDLFSWQAADNKAHAHVLLLSATPYKMYTLSREESGEDHYEDFVRTLRFLYDDPERASRVEELFRAYRRALLTLGDAEGKTPEAVKDELQARLRQVMVRTERLAVSQNRDGMLTQVPASLDCQLSESDVGCYLALQRAARLVHQPDTLEYWKSASYVLNFMENYKLKRELIKAMGDPRQVGEVAECFRCEGLLIRWDEVRQYGQIDPGNARLRTLVADTVDAGMWKLLWMPPSAPYYALGEPFAEASGRGITKRLVFSAWHIVPKVIASLLSLTAEREMFRAFEDAPENSPEWRSGRARLLDFSTSAGRLSGMPVLGLVYPSTTLARAFDPLWLARESPEELRDVDTLRARVRDQLEHMLGDLPEGPSTGPEDEAWYWAAPILLDFRHEKDAIRAWLDRGGLPKAWAGAGDAGEGWIAHVEAAQALARGDRLLGRRPGDLADVLAQVALAGPGNCALRALGRVSGGDATTPEVALRDAAGHVAHGFRALFNLPEVTALVRGLGGDGPYWRLVLDYALAGGLQATLDEYVHVLVESQGLFDKSSTEIAETVAAEVRRALTVRAARLSVDDIRVDEDGGSIGVISESMRARFAARFGDQQAEDGAEPTRADQVRAAFNSPFWPFVLASTSVGQEGLDFHPYCHAVVHWNLPSNPVDLEQREGRVHRYKGHAVRKNVAARYPIAGTAGNGPDPWEALFETARAERAEGDNDLVPYWVYPIENGAQIERHVPALPLSRDLERLGRLRESLVVYRMAFGQPRQEDLVNYLLSRFSADETVSKAAELRIDLSPPARRG
jgi:hypothetical protein